jgi:2-hydroxychromene-2-carboxylate isomerase
MPRITFWIEMASNYSYLSAMRIEAEAAAREVKVDWQPFLLGPIFQAQGWETSPFNIYEAKGRYVWRDMEREAAKLGLPPVTRPDPFPQHSLLAARVAQVGVEEDWGPGFVRGAYTAQFAEGRAISDPEVLAAVLAGLGMEPGPVLERARDQKVKDRLRAAGVLAGRFGLFGAPSFVCEDGEMFWGNDRLEDALDWAGR